MSTGFSVNISGQINIAGIVVDWRIDEAGNWIVPCGNQMAAYALAQGLSERLKSLGATTANPAPVARDTSREVQVLTPEPATAVVTATPFPIPSSAPKPKVSTPPKPVAVEADPPAPKRRGRPPKSKPGLI